MKGEYKVNQETLLKLWREAHSLASHLPKAKIKYVHIPRAKNKRADELSNIAMDLKSSSSLDTNMSNSNAIDTIKTYEVNKTEEDEEGKRKSLAIKVEDETEKEQQSYIGKKGYTLYKDSLALSDLTRIRNELTVKPYVPKSMVEAKAFPLYREAPKKIYVPRHYGEDNYGSVPDEFIKLPRGDPIEDKYCEFAGSLRDLSLIHI